MENEIKVFENEQFGKVRTVTINGEPWFVAKDVCDALNVEDTGKATARLDEDELTRIKIGSGGQLREMIFVNEPGLYGLVIGSRKSEAKMFKRWITHDVIPTIRKTGGYVSPDATAEFIEHYFSDFSEETKRAMIFELNAKNRELKAERDHLEEANAKLAEENDMLARGISQWGYVKIIGALVRYCAGCQFGGEFGLAWKAFYRELRYKHNINLYTRKGANSMVRRLKPEEEIIGVQVAAAMAKRCGANMARVINEVNASIIEGEAMTRTVA